MAHPLRRLGKHEHMRTVTLIAPLLLSLTGFAQGPHFGFKGGLNMSNLYSTEADANDVRIGFNAGFVGRTHLDKPVGLQAELIFTTKGNRTRYSAFFDLLDQEVQFDLSYFELPVLACFRFADNAFELQAGGYAAYLLGANVQTEGDLGSDSEEVDADKFNRVDAGAAAGLAFNTGIAQIGARYSLGLLELANSDEVDFLLGDAKNSCLQVYVAIGLPVGKQAEDALNN